MVWRVGRKARPAGPRRPPLDSARSQHPKSAAVASWVDLDRSAESDWVYKVSKKYREGAHARADLQAQERSHASEVESWWGEGILEVPFGRFLEAILTLDLALDSGTQGDSDTLPGLVHN